MPMREYQMMSESNPLRRTPKAVAMKENAIEAVTKINMFTSANRNILLINAIAASSVLYASCVSVDPTNLGSHKPSVKSPALKNFAAINSTGAPHVP
jgi:hypothetical protein